MKGLILRVVISCKPLVRSAAHRPTIPLANLVNGDGRPAIPFEAEVH